MSRPALTLLLLALAGCASVPPADAGGTIPEETAEPVRSGEDASVCDATRVRHLIGREQSEEVSGEALRLTGARALRWLRPGTVVTMDYRADRLNIHLDGNGKVTDLRCG